MQFLITAIVVVNLLVCLVSPCPSVCSCTGNSDGLYVDCYNRGLDSIPTDLPNNIYNLQLNHNNITGIQDSTFNNLPNLKYIYLNSNKITSIQSSAFNDLPNLHDLALNHNDITVIQDSTFNNLPNLRYLYLNSNKITSIQSSAFNDLPNLYYLQLHNNEISLIEENTFNNLTNLDYLSLHTNQITSIQSGTFNDLPSLYGLELQYNFISVIEDNSFNNLPNLRYLTMNNNPISLVSEHALENLPHLEPQFSGKFDMYCRGCGNIPFWRWLRRNHKFSTFTTCIDYGGMYLYYLQPNNVTDCFDCSTGTYGVSCEARCDTCVNRICDIFDGKCTYGCIEGFNGARCSLTATSQSATSYTAVYTGVGSFVVTALICVIIVLVILRYRRTKPNVHELERKGQNIREYQNGTFSDDSANIGVHYEETVITKEDQLYESIGQ